MSTPRPGRGARWGIGLSAAAVALFVGIVTGAVAVGQAVGGGGDCVSDPGAPGIFCFDDDLTEEALAEVVRVVPFDSFEDPADPQADPADDPFTASLPGWYLDLDYTTVDGEDVRATDIPWPRGVAEPIEGGTVRIAYDPSDPEFSVGSAQALAAARARPAAEDDGPAAALLWTTGVAVATAFALLGGTVVWARRAPRPERAAPVGWYGSPYGYPVGPPGYAPAYPQPYAQPYAQPYPQPYAQPYPQPYPQPSYPPAAAPPAGYAPPVPSAVPPPPQQPPAPPTSWDLPG